MKKHLLEEKIGLKIELNRINFLLFFFFLSSEVLPQIPINGFCKFNSYNFSPGNSKLFSLNFNNDSTDLISLILLRQILLFRVKMKIWKKRIFEFPHISNLAPIRKNNEIKIMRSSRKI
jgi:hypothetical protein